MAFQDVELSTERANDDDDACTQSEPLFCVDNAPRICNGGKWVIQAKCPQACIGVYGCVECKPPDSRCTDGKLERCSPTGRFELASDCTQDPDKPLCDANLDSCVECLPMDGHCLDKETLQLCKGGEFVDTQACSESVQGCITVDGQHDYCGECDSGKIRCLERVLKICRADWRYEEAPADDCDGNGCNVSTAMCNPAPAAPP